jgi:hypothetical protein
MSDASDPESFEPPKGFAFEPEFFPSAPRPLPDAVDRCEYRRAQRALRSALTAGAAACFVFARLAFVRRLGLVLLPLGYLDWIGAGLLCAAAVHAAYAAMKRGRYRYLVDGVPIAARVAGLRKILFVRLNGRDTAFGFEADVLVRHPDTQALKRLAVRSPSFAAASKDRFDASVRVGQYATAVYLPGRFEKTLNLYGFLQLNPDVQFVQDVSARVPKSRWRGARVALALFAVFGAALGCWYAFSFLEPVSLAEPALLWPALTGGALLAAAFILYRWKRQLRERRELDARNRAAAAEDRAVEAYSGLFAREGWRAWFFNFRLALAFVLAGAVLIAGALIAVNALFDSSPAELRPVRIQGMKETTYSFLVRSYSVEYSWPDSVESRDFPVPPSELNSFFSGEETFKYGLAEVHKGAFGWSWIKRVFPAAPPP